MNFRALKLSLLMTFLILLPLKVSSFEGPLSVSNRFPLFLNSNVPRLERATTEDSLSLTLSHSSVFMIRSSPEWSVRLDMEVSELGIRCRKIISGTLELGIDVPFLSFSSGFLDAFLDSYHGAFGFPDYGRSGRPDNSFLFEVRRRGDIVLQGRDGRIGLGDIRFTAKKVMVIGDPAISLLAAMELPTGSASRGFGNGSFDASVALLADRRLTEKVAAHLNFGVLFPGDLRAGVRVRLRDSLYGGAGLETSLSKDFSLLGQVILQGSSFPETGIAQVDRASVLLSLGGRYSRGKDSFEFSFTEDPNTSGAPDFTFAFSIRREF